MSYHYDYMRDRHAERLAEEIEDLIDNGELDPEDADKYYYEQMEEFEWGYADEMIDRYKDMEFGL